jgi:hypothetical protein
VNSMQAYMKSSHFKAFDRFCICLIFCRICILLSTYYQPRQGVFTFFMELSTVSFRLWSMQRMPTKCINPSKIDGFDANPCFLLSLKLCHRFPIPTRQSLDKTADSLFLLQESFKIATCRAII